MPTAAKVRCRGAGRGRAAGGRGDVVRLAAGGAAAGRRRRGAAGASDRRDGRALPGAGAEHARHGARGGGRAPTRSPSSRPPPRRSRAANIEHDDRRVAGGVRAGARAALASRHVARGYVSTAFGCPYEGAVDGGDVVRVAAALLGAGVRRGLDRRHDRRRRPRRRRPGGRGARSSAVPARADRAAPARHGRPGAGERRGRASSWASPSSTRSAGGVGGCPFAPGAPGNLATEELVALLDARGHRARRRPRPPHRRRRRAALTARGLTRSGRALAGFRCEGHPVPAIHPAVHVRSTGDRASDLGPPLREPGRQ